MPLLCERKKTMRKANGVLAPRAPKSNSTFRAVLIGFILIPINAYWIGLGSEVWYSLHITSASLFFNTVFSLFVIVILNLPLKKLRPSLSLSQGELLTVYVMLVMLSTVCGHTMMCYLLGILVHPFWFSTRENEWADLFLKDIPQWFTTQDKSILRGFFEGDSSLYTAEFIKTWLWPVLLWSAIIFALFFVFLCINVIIRRQWTEVDKLSYPIVQLPIEMTTPGFFSNRLMWIGFAVAGGIDIINGLHVLSPAIPGIPMKFYNINRFFTEKPWNAIGWTQASFYPFIIGLTFFVPLDLSFSAWFFYLFGKAERVLGSIMGWRALPAFPYLNEQGEGAWVALGILALWGSKNHLKQVFLKIFTKRSKLDEDDSPVSYRTAAIGILIGMTFLILLLKKAGMSIGVIALYFALYFAISIAITRVRAVLGPPVHEVIFMHPQRMMVATFGTRTLGSANLTILSFLYAFNRCNRAHPMPNQLEAFKIAERTEINNKKMISALIFALAFSIIISFWVYLDIMYKYGAAARCRGWILGIGRESFGHLESWLRYPRSIDYSGLSFMGFGAAFTVFLMLMRRRFLWWPFHPAGYALGPIGLGWFWCAILAGWAIKWIILRHGGLKAYRKAVPFFLGLILGEYVVGCIWSVIGVVFGIPVYSVWL